MGAYATAVLMQMMCSLTMVIAICHASVGMATSLSALRGTPVSVAPDVHLLRPSG